MRNLGRSKYRQLGKRNTEVGENRHEEGRKRDTIVGIIEESGEGRIMTRAKTLPNQRYKSKVKKMMITNWKVDPGDYLSITWISTRCIKYGLSSSTTMITHRATLTQVTNLLLIIRAKEKGIRVLDGNLEEGLRRVVFELMESEIKDLAYGQFLKAIGEERITTKRLSSMDEVLR
ncbi:hypothetical protein Tco_0332125 [Tanacetum coccineum]